MIIVENFPSVEKEIVKQVIKLTKTKHKERILKAAREKQQVTYKRNPIRLTADLSAETLWARREGHYIMIKKSIQEEDITIVNIYAPNIGAPQYIRQTLTYIKGETDSSTI